ncbi:F510_1955 family glycosylhydrolase [Qaidamihabitans albus]|uniref:F510_1955 family glycosylhydrolase n=1 Tax=Qaidamihabitans albus TaxID=2795733 RepID=UPI0018F1F70D|nr:sialidase family protein [Qaidamihabitans albus]
MAASSARTRVGLRRGPALAAAVLLLGACGGEQQQDGHGGEHGEGHGEGPGAVSLAHVHGLGINPADDTLYVASHHGLFRVTGDTPPEQIAGRTQDFMGFTITGPDHFLGSGHPGPGDTEQPAHLGLIESTDAGRTWQPVSLSGEADFHAMEADHGQVYGFDSVSGQIMVSTDKETWDRRAQVQVADLAVSPDEPGHLLATTEQGPARSTDGGRTFTPVDGAPVLVLLDWPSTGRLVGAGQDGRVHTSDDGGRTWTARGQAPGSPQAITTQGEAGIYLATDNGIHHSADGGRNFTLFQPL